MPRMRTVGTEGGRERVGEKHGIGKGQGSVTGGGWEWGAHWHGCVRFFQPPNRESTNRKLALFSFHPLHVPGCLGACSTPAVERAMEARLMVEGGHRAGRSERPLERKPAWERDPQRQGLGLQEAPTLWALEPVLRTFTEAWHGRGHLLSYCLPFQTRC